MLHRLTAATRRLLMTESMERGAVVSCLNDLIKTLSRW